MVVGQRLMPQLLPSWLKRAFGFPEPRFDARQAPIALDEITFQRCRDIDADILRVNALFNHPRARRQAAARDYHPRNVEQWRWEFSVPAAGIPRYLLALHRATLIGVMGYIPVPLRCGDSRIHSGKIEDILVHPDFRGIGVADRLLERLIQLGRKEELDLLWVLTSTAVNLMSRGGFQNVAPLDIWEAEPACAAESFDRPPSDNTPLHVRPLTCDDVRCDRFADEFANSVGGYTVDLSARFLRWRLFDNPHVSYQVFLAECRGRVIGLAAVKVDAASRVGVFTELAVLPGESSSTAPAAEALLNAGLVSLRENGCRRVQIRPAGTHPYNKMIRNILPRHGFTPRPGHHPSRLFVFPLRDLPLSPSAPENWRLNEILREY